MEENLNRKSVISKMETSTTRVETMVSSILEHTTQLGSLK
jgi:hypothetical protein